MKIFHKYLDNLMINMLVRMILIFKKLIEVNFRNKKLE